MAKIGVNLNIDVTKIDKNRMKTVNGKTYLDMTVFIDQESPGQYGDHGMITQNVTQEERAQNIKGPILGNCKVFWNDGGQPSASTQQQQVPQAAPMQQGQNQQQAAPSPGGFDDFDDDIPF